MLLMILVSGTYAARPRAPIAFDGGPDAEVLRAMDGER